MVARNLMGPMLLVVLMFPGCFAGAAEQVTSTGTAQLRVEPLATPEPKLDRSSPLFELLSTKQTGVDFVNRLDWQHPLGLLFDTGYACGGIAVGDVDGNGLPDLFFASALGRNRLYLQHSRWKFVESTIAAGFAGEDQQDLGGDGWGTGATFFDIDNDGDLDLYVCNYDAPNLLYVNHGKGTFDERAADYGLDIVDASLMPAVADYDRDGDLDIYLAVNRYFEEKQFRRSEVFYRREGSEFLRPAAEKYFTIRRHFDKPEQLNMWAGRTDRLLRNEGPDKKFIDVSKQMGLTRGDTLAATWWDYDHDGWPDIYVSNDLAAPDRLFHNKGDGTFEDVTLRSLPHTPWLSMGASAGDINNDGRVDFLAADMSFRTHFKDKAYMGDMSSKYRSVGFFPHDQLMRNALFVNTGTEHFQEAAHFSGLASTDWTWTAKLADLDNDGRLDAFFTNGTPVNLAGSSDSESFKHKATVLDTRVMRKQYSNLPPVMEQNLAYQNQGNLEFVDRSRAWGLDATGMSFGAVHADIDRDGDLDLIVANLDQPPSIYRNDSQQQGILIELRGEKSNRLGIGAELSVETDEGMQVRQIYPVAGFQSCQEATTHFGLGSAAVVRRLTVRWPSGAEQVFDSLPVGSKYVIEEPVAAVETELTRLPDAPLFRALPDSIVAEHHEEPFDDFRRQPLLPNRLSQLGPPMAWGDIDHDGDADLFLGEGADWMGVLFLNQGKSQFVVQPQVALARDEEAEDSAATFLDANGDGHLDLYVASGSIECAAGDELLRDRLYLGDGTGQLRSVSDDWLPDLRISTGAVAASDFDHDGQTDLFVGGRSIPGEYPLAPRHALLHNQSDRFDNVLEQLAPDLASAGMVTAAVWADVDDDAWDDLIVATDWGPVRLYLNRQGKLVESTKAAGLNRWTGWWQSLACADLDGDGDLDLVAGNFGLNTKYKASPESPVLAFYGEYGESGRRNLIEASYEDEVLFPLRGKSCSSAAMPHLTKQFSTYEQFAKATLPEIYTPRCLEQAKRFEINTLTSVCFINDGSGRFEMQPLPAAAQLAPVFAIALTEMNGDRIPDLFLGQNFFTPQKETGPLAGGLGVVAIGRGDGTFEALRPAKSGVVVPGDTKAVASVDLDGDGWQDICVATNNGPFKIFRRETTQSTSPSKVRPVTITSWSEKNLRLANQLFESEQFGQALPYLRRALKVAPRDAKALLLLATAHCEAERFGEAGEILDQLGMRQDVDRVELLIAAGRRFYGLQQYDRAAATLEQALRTRPSDQQANLHLGEVRLKQGLVSKAIHHFRLARRPDRVTDATQQAEVARLLCGQAEAAQLTGNDGEAIRFYEKSRRLDSLPQTLAALADVIESTADENLQDPWYAKQLRAWSDDRRATQSKNSLNGAG